MRTVLFLSLFSISTNAFSTDYITYDTDEWAVEFRPYSDCSTKKIKVDREYAMVSRPCYSLCEILNSTQDGIVCTTEGPRAGYGPNAQGKFYRSKGAICLKYDSRYNGTTSVRKACFQLIKKPRNRRP